MNEQPKPLSGVEALHGILDSMISVIPQDADEIVDELSRLGFEIVRKKPARRKRG